MRPKGKLSTCYRRMPRLPPASMAAISPRCNVVMPYHPLVECIYEDAKGAAQTGTTRRGMGPVYADKVSYNGIRLVDMADPDIFHQKLQTQLQVKNGLFKNL